ncbi:hypothetical protein NLJ89_g10287 [Agrocybe chaxingu]|uniref:Uncharacterized protein n=1 Tax=Agrocybe chaxingu TaxID=84603 RepID=A0A9W8JS15_9AGAR|nr:hypothetical protein NLJ89_g10287 [Agrocybe chaxingu]
MKSKIFFPLALLFATASTVFGAPQSVDPTEYLKLLHLCNKGGSNAYVAVRYQGNYYTTFKYNQCYPYEISGNLAEMAVFCKSATCYNNPNPDCTGGVVPPVPVPVPALTTVVNAAGWVQLLGQGATCQKNGLP